MLEIKVQCDCGQRFKFDVEPVHGQMPFTVACPVCGTDGTSKANAILATLPSPPPLPSVPHAAPAYVAATAASAAAVETAPSPVPGRAPIPRSGAARPQAAAAGQNGKPPSFGLGFLGAVAGAIIGALIYYLLFKYTGAKFKLIAIAVGFLSGMSAEWLGRREGSKELGMIAGALTLAAIVGAQYFVTKSWWMEVAAPPDPSAMYTEAVADAKVVVAAVPNGTDQEIRVLIAKEESEPGEEVKPSDIPDDVVKDFRDTTLKESQDLASGKITQQDFEKNLKQINGEEEATTPADEEGDFKAFFLIFFLSKVNLFSLAAAAGLAFKLCTNA